MLSHNLGHWLGGLRWSGDLHILAGQGELWLLLHHLPAQVDFKGSLAFVAATYHVALTFWPDIWIAGIRELPKEISFHKNAIVHETHLLIETMGEALNRFRGIRKVLLLEFVKVPERYIRLIAAETNHILGNWLG